jgi:hypothetical protein
MDKHGNGQLATSLVCWPSCTVSTTSLKSESENRVGASSFFCSASRALNPVTATVASGAIDLERSMTMLSSTGPVWMGG